MANNVADAVVAQLTVAGVQRIYGVIGDAVFPFVNALAKQKKLQFIAAAHETNAAYMASYDAKLTGRLTACMSTAGPGATNLATGLADAYVDGASVIAITGQVPTNKIGTDAKQYFDQQGFFGPITSMTMQPTTAESALPILLQAIDRATTHNTVAHVSIPKDVFEQPLQWTPLPFKSEAATDVRENGNARTGNGTAGAEDGPFPLQPLSSRNRQWHTYTVGDTQKALRTLHDAQRPLLIVGLSEPAAVREALKLAEVLGAAVVTAQQAKGSVPFDHDLLVGGIGEAHVPELVDDTDLIVLVGGAPYELRFIPARVPAIVAAPMYQVPPNRPLLAAWFGDVDASLRMLRGRVQSPAEEPERRTSSEQSGPSSRKTGGQWQKAIEGARKHLLEQAQQAASVPAEDRCNPYFLSLRLAERLAEDAVVAIDVGAFSHWFDLAFRVRRQTVLASPRWRGIGFALPAAIAARFAQPGRQAAAVVGDGAFLQSMGELTTAVRHQLSLLIVVVNNAVYDIERQKMGAEGFDSLGTDLPTPDFVAFAEACGAAAVRADTNGRVDDALKEAIGLAGAGPVVVDVRATAPSLPRLLGTTT